MFVDLVKFFHLIFALSLLGLTLFAVINARVLTLKNINLSLFLLTTLALLTGTLLVHPKHFTFHTQWIEAAYLLSFLFIGMVAILRLVQSIWMTRIIYLISVLLLSLIVHDAVLKTTFF